MEDMRLKTKGWRKSLSLAAALLVAWPTYVLFGYWWHQSPEGLVPGGRTLLAGLTEERDRPLSIAPMFSLRGALDEQGLRGAIARLRQDKLPSMSDALHLLRLFGPKVECRYDGDVRMPVIDIILDEAKSRACFQGKPSLIDTRYGVRSRIVVPRDARWQRERQSHEDQLLAVLAESGVPLSRLLTTSGGTRSVRNILDDTLANFDLQQAEIEWSALAILLYLPPQNSWADKFGKMCRFDDLAQELIDRPLSETLPCGGTHLLYTMALMLRVNDQRPILSPPIRSKLYTALRQFMAKAVRSQSVAGAWKLDWYKGFDAPTSIPASSKKSATEVLVTSHQVEWLMLLPSDMRPRNDCFLRALRWLQVALQSCDQETIREHYCPYSHAGRVLKLLTLDAD
jgi:hypothetical protein